MTGESPLLSPLTRLVGGVSATSSTHIPPFCPLWIIREWRAAKAVSTYFELQKCSSESWKCTDTTSMFFYSLWYMQINSSEVSPVTLYTKQSSAHKHCFNRPDETVGFHQKYSDIKTPALGFDFETCRAQPSVLGGIYNLWCHKYRKTTL